MKVSIIKSYTKEGVTFYLTDFSNSGVLPLRPMIAKHGNFLKLICSCGKVCNWGHSLGFGKDIEYFLLQEKKEGAVSFHLYVSPNFHGKIQTPIKDKDALFNRYVKFLNIDSLFSDKNERRITCYFQDIFYYKKAVSFVHTIQRFINTAGPENLIRANYLLCNSKENYYFGGLRAIGFSIKEANLLKRHIKPISKYFNSCYALLPAKVRIVTNQGLVEEVSGEPETSDEDDFKDSDDEDDPYLTYPIEDTFPIT